MISPRLTSSLYHMEGSRGHESLSSIDVDHAHEVLGPVWRSRATWPSRGLTSWARQRMRVDGGRKVFDGVDR